MIKTQKQQLTVAP